MKTKVSELTEEKLAEWTAMAQVWKRNEIDSVAAYWENSDGVHEYFVDNYRPNINGAQAMELAKKFNLQVDFERKMAWSERSPFSHTGATVKEAICRAAVAYVYGEYVEDT